MHAASPLRFSEFDAGAFLDRMGDVAPARYIARYLLDLDVGGVIEETSYFDRDYLAEFAAFYSTSARGYANTCARLHFFSGDGCSRERFSAAARGEPEAMALLSSQYLGFTVVRPLIRPTFGRTVLRWYPDQPPDGFAARVTAGARAYAVHVAGVRLCVEGLAWQAQDGNVGTCATVALWSMLHSAAFDDAHAIPTTPQITEAANRASSSGGRVFPSEGLSSNQLCDAIRNLGLSPVVLDGDLGETTELPEFTVERFASSCAALLRSNYPILLSATGEDGQNHAVCLTGFRPPLASVVPAGDIALADEGTQHFYAHDDNVGPNVRFHLESDERGRAKLTPDPPPHRGHHTEIEDPSSLGSLALTPNSLIVAVHDGLRLSADALWALGIPLCEHASRTLQMRGSDRGLSLGTRFISLRDYMAHELPRILGSVPLSLGKVRLGLAEETRPMSLHLGLIRIGNADEPLVDVLYDTTDGRMDSPAFAHVIYDANLGRLLDELAKALGLDIGHAVSAS